MLLILLLLAVLGAGGWFGWNSSALHLRRVEVAGTVRVAKEDIARASGLRAGAHLLKLPMERISARIERVPRIHSVKIERIIPSTVRVTVTEREPIAEVSVGPRTYLVDSEGVVLEEGTGQPIRVIDLPIEQVAIGERIRLDQYSSALSVARGIEPAVRRRLLRIRAPSVDRISLELDGGLLIVYGAPERMGEKNYAVRTVMEDLAKRGERAASIDVRVPERPAVRPA